MADRMRVTSFMEPQSTRSAGRRPGKAGGLDENGNSSWLRANGHNARTGLGPKPEALAREIVPSIARWRIGLRSAFYPRSLMSATALQRWCAPFCIKYSATMGPTNDEARKIGHSDSCFVILSSFVLRHSSL